MAVFEITTGHQNAALSQWKKSVERYVSGRPVGSPSPPWTCAHCGTEFEGRKRKFCGDVCAKEAKRIRDGKRRHSVHNGIPTRLHGGALVFRCAHCRSEFTGYRRKYCSAVCRDTARNLKAKTRTPEYRQAERAKMAAKRGKEYSPSGPEAQRLQFETSQSRLARTNAKQAWDYWLRKRAPDQWMSAYFEATGEPWRNPRLTDTEKYRIRYAIDPSFAIQERLRTQVKKAAKRDGVSELLRGALRRGGQSPMAEKLLGYTIDDLRRHLERQFTKGMNWDRFMASEIHIDHIIPKSKFDMREQDQWRKCWCLSNLQPLWARENLEKRDRVLYLL